MAHRFRLRCLPAEALLPTAPSSPTGPPPPVASSHGSMAMHGRSIGYSSCQRLRCSSTRQLNDQTYTHSTSRYHSGSVGNAKYQHRIAVLTRGMSLEGMLSKHYRNDNNRNLGFLTCTCIGCNNICPSIVAIHGRDGASRHARFVQRSTASFCGIASSSHPTAQLVARKSFNALSSSARETPVTMGSPSSSSSIASTLADSASLYPEDYQGKAGLIYKAKQPPYEGMVDAISIATTEDSSSENGSGSPLLLSSGAWALPHPEKLARGGEDAHFYGKNCVGVADGVGGWADLGVDPGIYSKEFMKGTVNALSEIANSAEKPALVMRQAHFYTNQEARGSTTACFAYLESDGSNILRIANVGDSALYLIRQGKLVFKTNVQQHDFNFPFQLGSDASDTADMADVFEQKVMKGDVIILGTDGLTDNVFDDDIINSAWKAVQAGMSPSDVAKELTIKAKMQSMNQKWMSPFAVSAAEFGLSFPGGKPDDISIAVSFVVEKEGRRRRPSPRL